MIKQGTVYLEIILALSILSVVAAVSLGFYMTNYKNYINISCNTNEAANMRIALEYLVDEIVSSDEIGLVKKVGSSDIYVEELNIENAVFAPANYLMAGSDKIYIINNIIRCNEKSNHVVSGIKSFSIKRRKPDLYTITVKTERLSNETNIYKRK